MQGSLQGSTMISVQIGHSSSKFFISAAKVFCSTTGSSIWDYFFSSSSIGCAFGTAKRMLVLLPNLGGRLESGADDDEEDDDDEEEEEEEEEEETLYFDSSI